MNYDPTKTTPPTQSTPLPELRDGLLGSTASVPSFDHRGTEPQIIEAAADANAVIETNEPADLQQQPVVLKTGRVAADQPGRRGLEAKAATTAALADEPDERPAGAPDLTLLFPSLLPVPPFPLDALPPGLRKTIDQLLKVRLTDPAFVATAAFATIAGALGTAVYLQVSPAEQEPCSIYGINIGATHTGKTVAYDFTAGELERLDMETALQSRVPAGRQRIAKVVEQERDRRLRQAIRQGIKVGEADFAVFEEEPPAAPAGLHTTNDATYAGLLDILEQQPRGILLTHQEVRSLVRGTMLRSPAGRAILLQGYDGGPYRRSLHKHPTLIPALQFSLCGATQPSRVVEVLDSDGDGFASRCLLAYPDIQYRADLPDRPNAKPIGFGPLLRRLSALPAGATTFGGQAVQLEVHGWHKLKSANRPWSKLAADLSGDALVSAFARARSHALRIALVIEIAEHGLAGKSGLPRYVTEETMRVAIHLVNTFYLPSAERALSHMRGVGDTDAFLRRIARWIAQNVDARGQFNVRVLRMLPRSPTRDAAIWEPIIDRLLQARCITTLQGNGKAGRPRGDFIADAAFVAAALTLA